MIVAVSAHGTKMHLNFNITTETELLITYEIMKVVSEVERHYKRTATKQGIICAKCSAYYSPDTRCGVIVYYNSEHHPILEDLQIDLHNGPIAIQFSYSL